MFGGLVVAAFAGGEFVFGRDEFAPERFGEDCLRQFLDISVGLAVAGFELIGEFGELLDTVYDDPLLIERGDDSWSRAR